MPKQRYKVDHKGNSIGMSLAGRRLLPREAATYLITEGWSAADKLIIGVATMQQESQFYTEAVGGPNADGTYDYGWTQINSNHWTLFGYPDPTAFKLDCFDPSLAIEFARKLYVWSSYSFRPWAAYTTKLYEKFLGNATIGVANAMAVQFGLTPIPYVKSA